MANDKGTKKERPARSLNWGNLLFLTLAPFAGIILTAHYIGAHGLHWMEGFSFLLLYFATGLSITAGYHRCFSHRSYQAAWPVRGFYLLFGAGALQNSALKWCRDHRRHHLKVDTSEDPYNIRKGFFYAHMGWIFFNNTNACAPNAVRDLERDPLIRWQDKYYLPIAILVGFGLPTLLGALVGRPFGGFLIGGLVRGCLVQHFTFCINSVAHYFGKQPYCVSNSARDSWWLALITYGEGYHNFHHRFAADYRNGHRWYQFDPTKWLIQVLKKMGLVRRLVSTSRVSILKARIETDVRRVELRLARAPRQTAASLKEKIQTARQQLESAFAQWEQARLSYRDLRKSMIEKTARRQWKLLLRNHRFQFKAAQARWALLVSHFKGFPGQYPFALKP